MTINFNPPGKYQNYVNFSHKIDRDVYITMNVELQQERLACSLCGGLEAEVGKIAGGPEAHCAKCRTWLRDSIRLLFFSSHLKYWLYELRRFINGKA